MKIISGIALRLIVLATMRDAMKRGSITRTQYRKAYQIRFPSTQVRILGSSTKVEHNIGRGMLTSIIYMAAHRESIAYGGRNFCAKATIKGCVPICIGHTAGHMRTSYDARAWRTLLFLFRPDIWREIISYELELLAGRAHRIGMVPGCRPNGCTDVLYEVIAPWMFSENPTIQFYDYSKILVRFDRPIPPNYYLVASRSENNEQECIALLKAKRANVAIVFRRLELAMKIGWRGFQVVNGDIDDCRPRDRLGVVIGLSPKGGVSTESDFFVG